MKSVTNANSRPFQAYRYGQDDGLRSSSLMASAAARAGRARRPRADSVCRTPGRPEDAHRVRGRRASPGRTRRPRAPRAAWPPRSRASGGGCPRAPRPWRPTPLRLLTRPARRTGSAWLRAAAVVEDAQRAGRQPHDEVGVAVAVQVAGGQRRRARPRSRPRRTRGRTARRVQPCRAEVAEERAGPSAAKDERGRAGRRRRSRGTGPGARRGRPGRVGAPRSGPCRRSARAGRRRPRPRRRSR